MNYQAQIRNFIVTHSGSTMTVFAKLYDIIMQFDKEVQASSIRFLCENYDTIKDGQNEKGIVEELKPCYTDEEMDKSFSRLKDKHFSDLIMAKLVESYTEGFEADRFYSSVWELVQGNKICKTKRDRILAFYNIVCFDYLPYMNIGIGVKMDNDKYKSIIDNLDSTLKSEIDYIVHFPYNQKTQTSSLLLERILSLKDREQQIVLLSIILTIVRKKVKDDIRDSLKYI